MITWDQSTSEGFAYALADELAAKGAISSADRRALQRPCELLRERREHEAGHSFEDPIKVSCNCLQWANSRLDMHDAVIHLTGAVDGQQLCFEIAGVDLFSLLDPTATPEGLATPEPFKFQIPAPVEPEGAPSGADALCDFVMAVCKSFTLLATHGAEVAFGALSANIGTLGLMSPPHSRIAARILPVLFTPGDR